MMYDIYRCAPTVTLDVVSYLRDLGIRAWVPQLMIRKRLPRSRKRVTVTRAAIPGYVFIPQFEKRPSCLWAGYHWTGLKPLWTVAGAQAACRQDELVHMQQQINGQGEIVLVGEPLEAVAFVETLPTDYSHLVGAMVTITAGPFAGFGGIVVGLDVEEGATLDLRNSLGLLKIPPCLLAPLAPMDRGTQGDHPHNQREVQDGADVRPPFPPDPGP